MVRPTHPSPLPLSFPSPSPLPRARGGWGPAQSLRRAVRRPPSAPAPAPAPAPPRASPLFGARRCRLRGWPSFAARRVGSPSSSLRWVRALAPLAARAAPLVPPAPAPRAVPRAAVLCFGRLVPPPCPLPPLPLPCRRWGRAAAGCVGVPPPPAPWRLWPPAPARCAGDGVPRGSADSDEWYLQYRIPEEPSASE